MKNLGVDQAAVFRIVEDNAKKRFEVVYGYDPSPPKPKTKAPKKKPVRVVPGAPVTVETVQEDLAKAAIQPEEPWTELEFVKLTEGENHPLAAWYIRAVQGHSIKLEGTGHLEELKDDAHGREVAGELVHGTQWALWETLSGWWDATLTDRRTGPQQDEQAACPSRPGAR